MGERDEDALHLLPFLHNEARVDFPEGLAQHVSILRRVLEAIEGLADFRLDIAVAWGELIAEHMQEGKIDLVGVVGIRRMDVWVDLHRVVEQAIEDIVALMFVGVHRNFKGTFPPAPPGATPQPHQGFHTL